jgi:gamma-butyrobetaine dioxygenase
MEAPVEPRSATRTVTGWSAGRYPEESGRDVPSASEASDWFRQGGLEGWRLSSERPELALGASVAGDRDSQGLTSASFAGELVLLRFGDGRSAELHPLALRDACGCVLCRHPVSGQRLFETRDVVPGARVESVTVRGNSLQIDWIDGHRSSFTEGWLGDEIDAAARSSRPRREPKLWGSELTELLPTVSYDEVVASSAALAPLLAAVADYGFALLSGAPVKEGAVAAVAELFSHVRTTNYGRVFDVSVRVDATNLADTPIPLSLHTDNPYRVPAPTLQLLQCLSTSVSGGETIPVDGFRAALLLAERSPEHLSELARRPIRFAYLDATAELSADVPVIELDTTGFPSAVRVNNRSKGVPAGMPDAVEAWYEAYFAFLSLLGDRDAQVVFRLEPGDVLVFDNLRVLRARTAFSGEGARRLQGCYADRDGLLSTLAVLERAAAPPRPSQESLPAFPTFKA